LRSVVSYVNTYTGADTQYELEEFKLPGDFVGREELILSIIEWIRRPPAYERVWVLTGAPGMGKSAISVGIARVLRRGSTQTHGLRLLHHHICMRSTAADDIQVKSFLESFIASCRDAKLTIGDGPFADLTSLFLSMKTIPSSPHTSSITYVLLIDGVDESSAITSLLSDESIRMMPSWLRLIITTRAVPGRDWSLSSLNHVSSLHPSLPSQSKALATFINSRFPPILRNLDLDATTTSNLIQTLNHQSDGSFVYARLIMDGINNGKILPTVEAITASHDLDGYYVELFGRRWPITDSGLAPPSYRHAQLVLEMMSHPYIRTNNLMMSCMIDGTSTRDDIAGAINMLTPVIELVNDRYYLHKSVMEWLEKKDNPYKIHSRTRQEFTEIRHNLAYFFRCAPKGWSLESTPLLSSIIYSWLECGPPTVMSKRLHVGGGERPEEVYFDISGRSFAGNGMNHNGFDLYPATPLNSLLYERQPTRFTKELFMALESERREVGKGFWSNKHLDKNVLHFLKKGVDNLSEWILLMPERFALVYLH
jgi:hypothetical protein